MTEGEEITVDLPNERTRARLVKIVDGDTIIAELTRATMMQLHSYKVGEMLAFRKGYDAFRGTFWTVEPGVRVKADEEVRTVTI